MVHFAEEGKKPFCHEWASIRMIDHMFERNSLSEAFAAHGLEDGHLHVIQQLILGAEDEAPPFFPWTDPPPEKKWLYQIVANKANGIDVDKFDYFQRDCRALGVSK
eukprot:CAMPEP_0118868970 /NCGR_PEP_ID=MMETSP1163-20130328/12430_1 /TAXON_ID=124430 /ORGANISM="Phaeomonas parva, Strain CCMP2877" /LENGTH=105 /DNA_ID=CAMNT_0006803799 /DNA_START=151 /DNA_END=465 /DNA_ORIENTATION=-